MHNLFIAIQWHSRNVTNGVNLPLSLHNRNSNNMDNRCSTNCRNYNVLRLYSFEMYCNFVKHCIIINKCIDKKQSEICMRTGLSHSFLLVHMHTQLIKSIFLSSLCLHNSLDLFKIHERIYCITLHNVDSSFLATIISDIYIDIIIINIY